MHVVFVSGNTPRLPSREFQLSNSARVMPVLHYCNLKANVKGSKVAEIVRVVEALGFEMSMGVAMREGTEFG